MAKKDIPQEVEIPTHELGLSQRIEAKLDMILKQLTEQDRTNAELAEWVKRMVRRGRQG
jgi:hypothetical protein